MQVDRRMRRSRTSGDTQSRTPLARANRRRERVGFAAETSTAVAFAAAKRIRKACDWIVANDVSVDKMGGADNCVHLITADGTESWERMDKHAVARKLAERIADALG